MAPRRRAAAWPPIDPLASDGGPGNGHGHRGGDSGSGSPTRRYPVSSPTAAVAVVRPGDPQGLLLKVGSSSGIELSWTSGGHTSGYEIAYQAGATAPADCATGNRASGRDHRPRHQQGDPPAALRVSVLVQGLRRRRRHAAFRDERDRRDDRAGKLGFEFDDDELTHFTASGDAPFQTALPGHASAKAAGSGTITDGQTSCLAGR